MYKFSTVKMYKFSTVKMYKFSTVKMYKFSTVKMYKFSTVKTYKFSTKLLITNKHMMFRYHNMYILHIGGYYSHIYINLLNNIYITLCHDTKLF